MVTGTRTSKRITNSPIIVGVIQKAILEQTQAVSLSDGLKYQPGLRVETDCQTCNYTQLRINGLQGGYSQILINSRPIFSPLVGLYGLEQIPTSMIERIEVVRGGASALFGSGAIGGTVNVITKHPRKNGLSAGHTFQSIDGAQEHITFGNGTLVNGKKTSGVSFFVNRREREWYDANGDNFSELPKLYNLAMGATYFYNPSSQHNLEVNVSTLHEQRYGGEMVNGQPHLAQQAEDRTHNILVGSFDYRWKLNDDKTSLSAYGGFQIAERDHYTGIFPDDEDEIQEHLQNPPYGQSENYTWQLGTQLNHELSEFPLGSNTLTAGVEYLRDIVHDVIYSYQYQIDQKAQNLGTFVQSDWEMGNQFNLLTGIRIDQHNLMDQIIANPRASLLYKPWKTTQIRATWGTGFRAPQAFDADMHIAFAGGGISRIQLDDDLTHERSNSLSTSINYDLPGDRWIWGFTVEGFHTNLNDAFYLQPLGEDEFGEVFEKRNGDGAVVQGVTLEWRSNFDEKIQLDAGFTIQSSKFDTPVENSDVLPAKREFLRTPNEYGYGTLTYDINDAWNFSVNMNYTGPMTILHLAGAPEQPEDDYVVSQAFTELGFRGSYTIDWKALGLNVQLFAGAKNITNAYQSDFDTGKNRDSNFVYGPAAPRTFFGGLKIQSR